MACHGAITEFEIFFEALAVEKLRLTPTSKLSERAAMPGSLAQLASVASLAVGQARYDRHHSTRRFYLVGDLGFALTTCTDCLGGGRLVGPGSRTSRTVTDVTVVVEETIAWSPEKGDFCVTHFLGNLTPRIAVSTAV